MVSGSEICSKRVVVDGRNHMLGRLASIVAKEVLNGQNEVVVRCKELCISGGPVWQKMKYLKMSYAYYSWSTHAPHPHSRGGAMAKRNACNEVKKNLWKHPNKHLQNVTN